MAASEVDHSRNPWQSAVVRESLGVEAQLAREAYNLFAPIYLEKYKDDVSKMHCYLQKFLKTIPPNGRIIDIGCANGAYVEYALSYGYDAIGIDISEAMLSAGKDKKTISGRLFQMDMHNIQFADDSFDGALCITALQYTTKLKARLVLSEIHRILRPGGALLLILLEGEKEGLETERFGTHSRQVYNAYYTLEELTGLLIMSDFVIERAFARRMLLETGNELFVFAKTTV